MRHVIVIADIGGSLSVIPKGKDLGSMRLATAIVDIGGLLSAIPKGKDQGPCTLRLQSELVSKGFQNINT